MGQQGQGNEVASRICRRLEGKGRQADRQAWGLGHPSTTHSTVSESCDPSKCSLFKEGIAYSLLCVCACGCVHAVAPVRRSEDNLWVVLNIRLIGSHLVVIKSFSDVLWLQTIVALLG